MNTQHYPFSLKPLPYAYDALEPYIDARTLHFHHDKHLQAYVDNLNKALEPYPYYHDWPLRKLLLQEEFLPKEIRTTVKNNAGGVYNHELYFDSMGPIRNKQPTGSLGSAINRDFGSYTEWQKQIKDAALSQFGSGWAWLVFDDTCKLHIVKTPNQDIPDSSLHPLLLVDVWEHAYYLQYQNRRGEYVDKWFPLVNWDIIESRYSCG